MSLLLSQASQAVYKYCDGGLKTAQVQCDAYCDILRSGLKTENSATTAVTTHTHAYARTRTRTHTPTHIPAAVS